MADYTNLKQQIAAAIRANGEGAITGPLLQEQLLDIVDAMEVDTWGGLITEDTVPPTDTDKPHVLLAVTEGYYEAFDLTVEEGDIWLVARMADEVEVVEDPETGETTEVPIWTKTNLAAGLKSLIEAIDTGKQDALTASDGISIEDNTISVKTGNGLTTDAQGNIVVDTDTVATNDSVAEYVSGQKNVADGIAGLDAEGKVETAQLPDDLVAFDEDGEDPSEEFDELRRLLAALYQAIADVQQTQRDMEATTADCEEVTEEARSVTESTINAKNAALSAASSATDAAQRANTAAEDVEDVIADAQTLMANMVSATTDAVNAAQNATEKSTLAENAASEASSAASRATDAAALAEQNAEICSDAATEASTQALYAESQGDYAKEQGDAAKEVVDEGIVLEETLQPTDQELIDEYDRVLRQAYQGIEDMQQANAASESATTAAESSATRAISAASAAEGVISDAREATIECSEVTDEAKQVKAACITATTLATQSAQAATTAANATQEAITDAETATQAASQAATTANNAADDANSAADACNDAMAAAKGDFPSLADRLDDIDATIIEFVEDNTDTFTF